MTTIANARANLDRTPNHASGQYAIDKATAYEINRLEAMIRTDNKEQALAHLAEIKVDLAAAMRPTPGATRVIGQDGVTIVNPHRVVDPVKTDAGTPADTTGKEVTLAEPVVVPEPKPADAGTDADTTGKEVTLAEPVVVPEPKPADAGTDAEKDEKTGG